MMVYKIWREACQGKGMRSGMQITNSLSFGKGCKCEHIIVKPYVHSKLHPIKDKKRKLLKQAKVIAGWRFRLLVIKVNGLLLVDAIPLGRAGS
jgi:hypothetical protein